MADKDKNEKNEGLVQRLLDMRTVLIAGEINQKVAQQVMAQLLVLDGQSNDPIRMVVSSPGGHVESGFAIYDFMRFVKSPITAVGAGWVASIAVPIMFGAKKERRVSLPNTRFLIHQPWMGGGGGPASDIGIIAEEMIKLRDRLNQMIADETGQDLEKVAKDSDRDYWMTAEQAVEYGLISRVVAQAGELD
ncbi:MAG: ATP-dependent Clp protease proteolytic subunit [Acidobacteriota bacterium]